MLITEHERPWFIDWIMICYGLCTPGCKSFQSVHLPCLVILMLISAQNTFFLRFRMVLLGSFIIICFDPMATMAARSRSSFFGRTGRLPALHGRLASVRLEDWYPLVIKRGNGKFPKNGPFYQENHWQVVHFPMTWLITRGCRFITTNKNCWIGNGIYSWLGLWTNPLLKEATL